MRTLVQSVHHVPDHKQDSATRTSTILAPDSDSGQVASADLAALEELVKRAPDGAAARVDLRPRLPLVIVGVLQRVGGDDGASSKEGPALGALEALVIDLDQVREDIGGLERHVGERGWKGDADDVSRVSASSKQCVAGSCTAPATAQTQHLCYDTHIRGNELLSIGRSQFGSQPTRTRSGRTGLSWALRARDLHTLLLEV